MMLVNHLVVSLTGWHAITQSGVLPAPELTAPWTYSMVALGTALPDIDHPHSTLGSKVKWLSWPITIVFGHRNITHSLLIVAALAYMAYVLPLTIPLVAGYVFHLFGDWLTPAGLKLFYPVGRVYRAPITIPTNSLIEYVAVWGISGLVWTFMYQSQMALP